MIAKRIVVPALLLALVASPAVIAADPTIEHGRKVTLELTLTLEDGTEVVSNVGKKPFVYTHGVDRILPALAEALAGLKVDDSKQVRLTPEEGYGPVDPDAFIEVDPESIPADSRKVGAVLVARNAAGIQRYARVHELGEDHIVLDYNHPLAGKVLLYDVHVVDID